MSAIAETFRKPATSTLISETTVTVSWVGQLVGRLVVVRPREEPCDFLPSRAAEQGVLDALDAPPSR